MVIITALLHGRMNLSGDILLRVTRVLLGILIDVRGRCRGGRGFYPVCGIGVTGVKSLGWDPVGERAAQ